VALKGIWAVSVLASILILGMISENVAYGSVLGDDVDVIFTGLEEFGIFGVEDVLIEGGGAILDFVLDDDPLCPILIHVAIPSDLMIGIDYFTNPDTCFTPVVIPPHDVHIGDIDFLDEEREPVPTAVVSVDCFDSGIPSDNKLPLPSFFENNVWLTFDEPIVVLDGGFLPVCDIEIIHGELNVVDVMVDAGSPGPFAGPVIQFNVIVNNDGPGIAENVVVIDVMETEIVGLELVNSTPQCVATLTGFECSFGDLSAEDGNVEGTVFFQIPLGASGLITNTATVFTDSIDIHPENDVSSFENLILSDIDGDSIADETDNCPDVFNPQQEDLNDNGIGDACEVPETPQEQIQDLIDNIVTELPEDIAQSLVAPLENAIKLLDDDNLKNDGAVCGKLGAVDNKIDAKEGKKNGLTSGQADALRTVLAPINTALDCV